MISLSLPQPKSYEAGRHFSNKVREFDPIAHEVMGEGNTHNRYNCPYCLDVRGKVDDDAKFYWDRNQLIGFCFKCNTVGVLKTDKPISEVALHTALMGFKSKIEIKTFDNYKFSPIPYDKLFNPLDDEGREYLLSRTPIYDQLFDHFNLRVSPKYGIALPIYIDDELVSYTLRIYNPPTKMKYYIPDGQKYLYSPTNAINKRNLFSEITLTEGPFSALGALFDGWSHPIAIQGNTMTPLQIYLVRRMMPSKINIYLDTTSLSWKLYHKIKKIFPSCSDFNMVPTNYDPEEKLQYRIGRLNTEEDYNSLLSDVNKALEIVKSNQVK